SVGSVAFRSRGIVVARGGPARPSLARRDISGPRDRRIVEVTQGPAGGTRLALSTRRGVSVRKTGEAQRKAARAGRAGEGASGERSARSARAPDGPPATIGGSTDGERGSSPGVREQGVR